MGEVQKTMFSLKIAPDGKDSENRCGEYYCYSSGKTEDVNSIKKMKGSQKRFTHLIFLFYCKLWKTERNLISDEKSKRCNLRNKWVVFFLKNEIEICWIFVALIVQYGSSISRSLKGLDLWHFIVTAALRLRRLIFVSFRRIKILDYISYY